MKGRKKKQTKRKRVKGREKQVGGKDDDMNEGRIVEVKAREEGERGRRREKGRKGVEEGGRECRKWRSRERRWIMDESILTSP